MADPTTAEIRGRTQAKQHSRRPHDLRIAVQVLYPLVIQRLNGTPLEEVQGEGVKLGWPGFNSREECGAFFKYDPNAVWEIILNLAQLTDGDPLAFLSWFSRRHQIGVVWLEDVYYVATLAVLEWLADNYTFYNPNESKNG